MNILRIVDPCDGGVLNTEAACFAKLSKTERDAAIVWYLWQAAIEGGFSSDIEDLLEAGACFAVEPPNELHAMEVVIAGNAAVAAGASVEVTIAEVVEGIKCLKHASPQKIYALKVLLLCKLNAAIA